MERFAHPERRLFLVIFGFVAGTVFGFLVGARYYSDQMTQKQAQQKALQQAEKEIHQLELDRIQLATSQAVDSAAAKRLSETLFKVENDLAGARDELRLYKSLMGGSGSTETPTVRALRLRQLEPGKVAYLLVLEQGGSSKGKKSTIRVAAHLVAEQDTIIANLDLSALDNSFPGHEEDIPIRYFKIIEGVISIPEGLVPREVVIRIWQKGRENEAQERSFPWKIIS